MFKSEFRRKKRALVKKLALQQLEKEKEMLEQEIRGRERKVENWKELL